MPTSPAVLKAAKTASSTSRSSYAGALTSAAKPSTYVAASSSQAVASTSKLPAEADNEQDKDDEIDEDPAWQGITEDGNDNAQDDDDDDDDDAVMIDSNILLPPIQSGKHAENPDSAANAEQGTLKFAPLSAKEMQGKVETQLRRVAVSRKTRDDQHAI